MTSIKFQVKCSQNNSWRMDRPHFHEDIELLLCLSDGGDLLLGSELYPLRRGELFVIPEATLHRSISSQEYERYILHIPSILLRELSTPQSNFAHLLGGGCPSVALKETTLEGLVKLFRELEVPIKGGFGGDVKAIISMLKLLLAVCDAMDHPVEAKSPSVPEWSRIAPVLEYIAQNIEQQLTLDTLSNQFFLNKYHLCHTFKAATGFSVMEYIIHSRVLKARELLRGGMRVQEVGETVGFQNNQHFIRTFGTITGTSPKKYAREYLEGDKT